MKISNKKRLETLEKTKPLSISSNIIIFDPTSPPAEFTCDKSAGVRIYIPDNGRTKHFSAPKIMNLPSAPDS